MDDWQDNLIDDATRIAELLRSASRVAVLGIKTEQQSTQPAYYVPHYLQRAGYDVVPVPVYYPDATEILGAPVYRSVAEIPGEVDIVFVFRRSPDVAKHLDDLLAARPGAVWMQSGIRNAEAAESLAKAGVRVVQDRCAMIEHRRLR
jgi:uncharacterized protein